MAHMRVPQHQIHNVLEAYKTLVAKKLRGESSSENSGDFEPAVLSRKRSAVLSKAIDDMTVRLLKSPSTEKPEDQCFFRQENSEDGIPGESWVAYNSIVGRNRKIPCVIDIKNVAEWECEEDPD